MLLELKPQSSEKGFWFSLLGLALLPLTPELVLFFRNHGDLKQLGPICYYEEIVSVLLLAPALFFNRFFSRLWVIAIASVTGVATAILTFYSGWEAVRWNLTAHTALMQTNVAEARGFLGSFASVGSLILVLVVGATFAICALVNVRAKAPTRRRALIVVSLSLLVSAYGIHNAIRYGGALRRKITVLGGATFNVIDISINKFHPLTLLAVTHYNYWATHAFYLQRYEEIEHYRAQLGGAVPAKDSAGPRIAVVVVGESANRVHWSLYGYPRKTTPELDAIADDLKIFSDVISVSVATQTSIRAMFTTTGESIPIFPLFSQAGYMTHWLSAQYSQGVNDVEVTALVRSCDECMFLNGAYDERLLPQLQKAVAAPGRHVIFINLFGSHIRYQDRYPASYAVFTGASEKDRLRATYDNSIRYTDHVLAAMIALLRGRQESSCLLYVSDHGEDVYDSTPDQYLFRDEVHATNPMYEVPFFVWFSPEYKKSNADFVRAVAATVDRKYQTLALYQSVLDLVRLRHPLYDPKMSVFSPDFVERERRVGAVGRLYEKEKR